MGTTKTERNKIMTSSMGSQGPGWQPPGFTPGQAVIPTSTVEISISCNQLEDMDVFSKSDPFCVLYVKDSKSKQWHCFGKTETIDNTLEPYFEKKFVLHYKFEERQQLRFDVYDSDSNSANLDDHDFIGSMECSRGEVITQTECDHLPAVYRRRSTSADLGEFPPCLGSWPCKTQSSSRLSPLFTFAHSFI